MTCNNVNSTENENSNEHVSQNSMCLQNLEPRALREQIFGMLVSRVPFRAVC